MSRRVRHRAQITLPRDLDIRVRDATSPSQMLAAALSDGLRALMLVRDSFDVIVFYLPPRFAPYFTDGPSTCTTRSRPPEQNSAWPPRSSPMSSFVSAAKGTPWT